VSSCPPSKYSSTECGPASHHYHLNPEHAVSDADSEIADSEGVRVFGIKSEGHVPPLWIRDSANILMSGHGGNLLPPAVSGVYPEHIAAYTPSLYRIERSTNVTLANLWRYARGEPEEYEWSAVLWIDGNGTNHTATPCDRPVIYRVGS